MQPSATGPVAATSLTSDRLTPIGSQRVRQSAQIVASNPTSRSRPASVLSSSASHADHEWIALRWTSHGNSPDRYDSWMHTWYMTCPTCGLLFSFEHDYSPFDMQVEVDIENPERYEVSVSGETVHICPA